MNDFTCLLKSLCDTLCSSHVVSVSVTKIKLWLTVFSITDGISESVLADVSLTFYPQGQFSCHSLFVNGNLCQSSIKVGKLATKEPN